MRHALRGLEKTAGLADVLAPLVERPLAVEWQKIHAKTYPPVGEGALVVSILLVIHAKTYPPVGEGALVVFILRYFRFDRRCECVGAFGLRSDPWCVQQVYVLMRSVRWPRGSGTRAGRPAGTSAR